MAAVEQPFPERMAWFWHGHFATSARKVRSAALMYGQNARCAGSAPATSARSRRRWSSTRRCSSGSTAVETPSGRPNENLAREFMELFTLGIGAYSETDVREAARALTGWRVDAAAAGSAAFIPRNHDGGPKTVLGTTAPFDAPGLVDLLVAAPASARFLATRVWARFVAHTPPDPATLDALAGAYGPGRDVTALVRAAVSTPAFRDGASVLVRQPVEWLVGALRALKLRASAVPAAALRGGLTGLGQVPFLPPDVGGWPAGPPWLTTTAALRRLTLARALAGTGDIGPVADAAPAARVDAAAAVLGLPGFGARTAAALAPLAGRPPDLVAAALASPENAVSA